MSHTLGLSFTPASTDRSDMSVPALRRPAGRQAHAAHRRARPLARRLAAAWILAAAAAPLSCSQASTSPTEPTPDGPVVYAAIGASDAVGVGASVVCIPFAECPNGTGYVPVIGRRLAVGGRQVSVTNLGIPAAVLSPAIQALGNQYNRGIPGNFLEQELPFVPRTATVVTIFAGGNDANAIGTALAGGEGGFDPLGWIEQQVRGFATDYQTLVRGVKERAPSATIVVANLPNFAGMPFTRDWTPEKRLILQRITVGMTVQGINGFASQGIPVVDMMCDDRMYQSSTFSSDGFHPNDTGYGYLADEMLRAINAPSSYPAPRSSCTHMFKVPSF